MARRIVVTFDAANQSLLAADIITAGALETIPLDNAYPFVFLNIARSLSFHSTSDLSGVTFTVTGSDQYGGFLDETLIGPTAGNTVYTMGLYHTVENIEADGAIANLSIGSGQTGVSQWLAVNNFSVEGSLNLQVVRNPTITYSITQTNDPLGNYLNAGASYEYVVSPPAPFPVDASLTNATTSQLFKVEIPSGAYQIAITMSSGAGSLDFIILQQGIR